MESTQDFQTCGLLKFILPLTDQILCFYLFLKCFLSDINCKADPESVLPREVAFHYKLAWFGELVSISV